MNRFHYAWIIVIAGLLCSVCFGVSRHLYPLVLPTMEAELGLLHGTMGNIASAYFLAYAIMTFVWGILTDRIGPRKCMLMGLVLIMIGLLGMGFMSSVIVGFLCYILCGAGAAAQFVPLAPLVSHWFSGARRGTAIGISMMGVGTITLVMGFTVPAILASYSWQWSWWIGAVFVFVMAVICWFLLVDTPAEKGLKPIGVAKRELSALGGSPAENSEHMGFMVAVRQVIKRGTSWHLAFLYFTRGAGCVAFMTFAVAYLEEIGWGVEAAARVFALWGALTIIGPLAWGIVADRLTKKYAFIVALALEAVGLFVFLGGSPAGCYVGAAVIGFADVGIPAIMAASMADYYEPPIVGTAFGFVTFLFGIGAMIGPAVGGALADRTGTLSTAILLSFGALILSFVLALVLKKPAKS